MKLTKNFTEKEMECSCGCGALPTPDFMNQLQILRTLVGFPLHINSGARCASHNKAIGGASKSQHVEGMAADIRWDNLTGDLRHKLLESSVKIFNGIGLHENFLHVDLRKNKSVWFY